MQRGALCRSRRVHCVDLGESFPTSIYYLLAKFGFDTAENEPCEVCPIPRGAACSGQGRRGVLARPPWRAGCRGGRRRCGPSPPGTWGTQILTSPNLKDDMLISSFNGLLRVLDTFLAYFASRCTPYPPDVYRLTEEETI